MSITNEKSTIDQLHLGLTVLDEPSATQSDPALLHLQLRASSVNVSHTANVVWEFAIKMFKILIDIFKGC